MTVYPEDLLKGKLNTWEASAVGNIAPRVSLVWRWIPGKAAGSAVSVSNLVDGLHVLWLKAVDLAGNVSPLPLVTNWTVDTVPPGCRVIAVNGGSVVDSGPQLNFGAPWSRKGASVSVSGLAGSGSPLKAVHYYLRANATGGRSFSGREPVSPSSSLANISLSNLTDGSHTLWVYGQDRAGNLSPKPCANVSWTVDLTPPVSRFVGCSLVHFSSLFVCSFVC